MGFAYEVIKCQDPQNSQYVERNYVIVKVIFNNNEANFRRMKDKA